MEHVVLCDRTLKQGEKGLSLSFREKIELSRLIDRLGVDWIELAPIRQEKVDSLLIKSVASAVKNAGIAVPVKPGSDIRPAWNALKEAKKARLQVFAPVSSVQMEYLYHMKPQKMLAAVSETVRACRACTENVEFIADDATRSDAVFLRQVISAAVEAGAATVTLCDTAGVMLPEEMSAFLTAVMDEMPSRDRVVWGADCSDAISMADSCAMAALRVGIREIKAESCRFDGVSLPNLVRLLSLKGEKLGVGCQVRTEELRRVTGQIETLCRGSAGVYSASGAGIPGHEGEVALTRHDSKESILRAIERLGYALSEEDAEKVWTSFQGIAARKDEVTLRELDAIVAAEAMQVPPAYQVISYVVNTGNVISAMAHMKLDFHGKQMEGISVGDGVIDAAFLAIEKTTGRHFELDDFQIQAIAEGREAMGETVVKLRSSGKLYSGRGISTDIVGASIMAYLNALNKIVYEEEEA